MASFGGAGMLFASGWSLKAFSSSLLVLPPVPHPMTAAAKAATVTKRRTLLNRPLNVIFARSTYSAEAELRSWDWSAPAAWSWHDRR